ncbi:hypothetical protein ACT29H_01645 [Thermophagus sp. OGC60D27]|uniref:hypothetical protein n=1 Tax=Thermophagus sp. OGC60D27 TaxID=3458415 RepID=UPI0040382F57
MEKQNVKVALPIEVLNDVINMLSSLPYRQVAGVMRKIDETAVQVNVNEGEEKQTAKPRSK